MSIHNTDEPVFMISVAARLCRMHPQTLRLYERLGLVAPSRRNGRNRLYSQQDIERLQQIQRLTQELGVNLAGVEVILDLLERLRELQTQSQNQIEQMRLQYLAEIERLRKASGM